MVLKWRPNQPLAPDQKLPLLAALYLIAPLILWGASQLEGVPFSDYGLDWRLSVLGSLGLGLGVGKSFLSFFFIKFNLCR